MTDPRTAKTLPTPLPSDPLHWVEAWLDDAMQKAVQRNPNSMTVVTVNGDGRPSARVVLCKAFVADPGYLVFYTNYKSDKARHIDNNANVALVFHWDGLGRQARLEGEAVVSPAAESDAYFATRDWGSKLGAWGSDQSAPIESRAALVKQVGQRAVKLGVDTAKNLGTIPRPPHWGGIRVWPRRVELWLEGQDRIHDRARWERNLERGEGDQFIVGDWHGTRLQP